MTDTGFAYNNHFSNLIDNLQTEGRYREFAALERFVGRFPDVKWHTPDGEIVDVTVWCSNDYLGMGHNPKVIGAMQQTLNRNGAGSGGTRNISGTHRHIVELENELADLHDKESALVFSSGYVANETAISTLAKHLPNCIIFSDSDNHASMIQGVKGGRCDKVIFRHNDVEHLRSLLEEVDINRPKIIAFESVYSMDGDFSPIEEICDLAKEFQALTYLDETHGVGLYGHKGGGLAQEWGLTDRIDVLQGGIGKGFGVVGGFVTANSVIIDVIRSYGAGFIFTTSIPPVIAAGAVASIRHLKQSSKEREAHQAKARELKSLMMDEDLPILDAPSHIVPLMVRDSFLCKSVTDRLLHVHGIYIQPINYPTVPKGTERLRITPTPLHTTAHLKRLVECLLETWQHFDLPKERFDLPKKRSEHNYAAA